MTAREQKLCFLWCGVVPDRKTVGKAGSKARPPTHQVLNCGGSSYMYMCGFLALTWYPSPASSCGVPSGPADSEQSAP